MRTYTRIYRTGLSSFSAEEKKEEKEEEEGEEVGERTDDPPAPASNSRAVRRSAKLRVFSYLVWIYYSNCAM